MEMVLVCVGAVQGGMRSSFWYALVQVSLICEGEVGMRRQRSFWYTEAKVILVWASTFDQHF